MSTATKRLVSCDEAINEIADCLAEADGEMIASIYNHVMASKAIYLEDSLMEIDDSPIEDL